MKTALLIVLLMTGFVAGCGEPLAKTSRHLEPLMDDEPWPPGDDRCFFATEDGAPAYVRFISRGNEAVVRVKGRPLLLSYEGKNVRGGGTFRRGALSVTIAGISSAGAKSATPIGEMAVVTVRDVDVQEKFEALWTC